jgi:biopolymer transport protein ExbD
MHRMVIVALVLEVFASWSVGALATPAGTADDSKGFIIRTLPGIVIDTRAREVRLEGQVCLREGGLELLVCSEGTREHESVVVVKAKPSHVSFALAMLGLKEGRPGFETAGGTFSPPAGDEVDISVRFTIEKKEGAAATTEVREAPAWNLMRLAGSEATPIRPLEWVYVGRQSKEALAAADREGTVVCVSNFPEAVLDVPFESTDVNADLLYAANPDVVPAVGTPAEVVIRPTGRRIEPRKVEIEVVLRKGEPLALDGKPMDLKALREAVNAAPAEVRSAVIRADPDERFGRVMEVNDICRGALMRVTMFVLAPAKQPVAGPAQSPPLELAITADDQVRVGGQKITIQALREKAAAVFKGAERALLVPEKGASFKTVAEVMTIAHDQGVPATVSQAAAPPK